MAELDVIWMACLMLLPVAGGVLAALAPCRWPDLGAWITTMVSLAALGTAIAVLILFKYDTLDQLGVLNDAEFRHKASLAYRSAMADLADDYEVKSSVDWVGRTRWAGAWGLDILWGLDGASMACVLAITASFLVASLVGWRPGPSAGVWRFCLLGLESALLAACLWQNLALLAGVACLATLLAAQLARLSNLGSALVARIQLAGYVASLCLLVSAALLRGFDCHDHAPPDRLEQMAWQQVRSQPDARFEEVYHRLTYHTFDLPVLARAARAAWHGREVEALTLERWRARQELARVRGELTDGKNVSEQFIADEVVGFNERKTAWLSGSRAWIAAMLLVAATWLLLNIWPAPMAWGSCATESHAGAFVALAAYGVLGLVVLFQAAWPLLPWVLLPGGALHGLAPWIALVGMAGTWVVLLQARTISTMVTGAASGLSALALAAALAWPAAATSEDVSWALNGGLFLGLAALLGVVASWAGLAATDPAKPAPVGLLRLMAMIQVGLPGTLGFVGLVLAMVALERTGVWLVMAWAAAFFVMVVLVLRLAGRLGDSQARVEWKPRSMVVVAVALLPLVVPGVIPILMTSWCEPAMTARAEWLVGLPEAAPGQGAPLPRAPKP